MIEHIVLFKFKSDITSKDISDMEIGLRSLINEIPQILSLSTGQNFSTRAKGFDQGLVVRFENRENLEIYQKHPAHQEMLKDKIKPIAADIIAVDYEF